MDLLERDSFIDELESMLKDALAGQGHIALVSGEAGVGKTSLVEHFTRSHRKAVRVLWGTCDALFTPRPLGPLHDISMQFDGPLLTLLNSSADRQSIFLACLAGLQNQSAIVVFEDVHWADEATLDLIKFLGRRIQRTAALLILTYRDDELGASHPLRLVLGELPHAWARHLQLLPLSKLAILALANKAEQPARADELFAITGGNPFFVTEALASKSKGIPVTVRDAVLARAARLSLQAHAILDAAAVIGPKIEPWLLSEMGPKGVAFAEECISAGMLQVQNETWGFRHEIARQTILESISSERRRGLHRLALNILRARPETSGDLARLANHAQGTQDAKAVLEFAPAAARQASKLGAHRQAAVQYKSALQYGDHLALQARAEMLDAYADESDLTDEIDDAEQAQQEALRVWRKLGRRDKEGRALRHLSEIAIKLNKKSEISFYGDKAIRVLETLPASKELARAYSLKSRLHMLNAESSETVYWGSRALELAERLGDVETQAHALVNIGLEDIHSSGQHAQGFAKLKRSLELSLNHGLHDQGARAYYNLTANYTNFFIHDYAAGLHYANEGIAYCIQHDLDYWHIGLLGLRARTQLKQGYWLEAERDLREAQTFWGAMERRAIVEPTYLLLKVRRGDSLSQEELEAGLEFARKSANIESAFVAATLLAEAAWLQGDLARCRVEAEAMFTIACQRGASRYIGELGYWLWRAGAIEQTPAGSVEPYVTQIAGDWKAAAVMWEQFGYPYEQAMALMDGDESAQLAALAIFDRLGARPMIGILKAKLRSQGIRIPLGPRPATRENPFGLTAREMEVLGCLVERKMNHAIARQLGISSRTVEHHVASILKKMQVKSRAEAVALAGEENRFPN